MNPVGDSPLGLRPGRKAMVGDKVNEDRTLGLLFSDRRWVALGPDHPIERVRIAQGGCARLEHKRIPTNLQGNLDSRERARVNQEPAPAEVQSDTAIGSRVKRPDEEVKVINVRLPKELKVARRLPIGRMPTVGPRWLTLGAKPGSALGGISELILISKWKTPRARLTEAATTSR